MMRGAAATAFLCAMALALAACGGSDDGAAADAGTPPLAAPQAAPTPAQQATPTLQHEHTVTPAPTSVPATDSSSPAGDSDGELADRLRERTVQMWAVYNSYDLEGLRAFYEPRYWEAEEEELRRNMAPISAAGVTVQAKEKSPPTEIAPGVWELRHDASFAFASFVMVFQYQEFDGEWLLTYAEAQ